MRLKSDPVSTSPGISGDHSYRVIPWPLVSTVLVVGVKDYSFCKRLKSLRENAGLTQVELERKSNLPSVVVSHYERGERQPGLENIKSLCKGLGCTASELIGI